MQQHSWGKVQTSKPAGPRFLVDWNSNDLNKFVKEMFQMWTFMHRQILIKCFRLKEVKSINNLRWGQKLFIINLKCLIFSVSFLLNSIHGRLKCVGDLKFLIPHKTFSFVIAAQFPMKITFLFLLFSAKSIINTGEEAMVGTEPEENRKKNSEQTNAHVAPILSRRPMWLLKHTHL